MGPAALVLFSLWGCSTPQIDIADAAATKGITQRTIELSGGTIQPKHMGVWERICKSGGGPPSKGQQGCKDLFFYAAPIVPDGWTPDAPVTAWATCPNEAKSAQACAAILAKPSGTLTARVLSRHGADSGWTKAIAHAREQHGVKTAEAAPILLITDD